MSDELFAKMERFICALYGPPEHSSVNDLRYDMFCLKAAQCSQLPPTKDALQKHVLRANYQAAIWHRALCAMPEIPDPMDGHGWIEKDGEVCIDWMNQLPAPLELLEMVSCGCQRGCTSGRCSCSKAGLPCTEACRCSNCDNKAETCDADGDDADKDKGEDSEAEA